MQILNNNQIYILNPCIYFKSNFDLLDLFKFDTLLNFLRWKGHPTFGN